MMSKLKLNIIAFLKLKPFIICFIYILFLLFILCKSEYDIYCRIADYIIMSSPLYITFNLIESFKLKFCIYHKITTVIPLLSYCMLILDSIFTLTNREINVMLIVICVDSFLLLINSILMLWHGRLKTNQ